MIYGLIEQFHKLAFFRVAPVPALLSIVVDAHRCTGVFGAAELIQRRLAKLVPGDAAIGVLQELSLVLADPPADDEWRETLAYLEYAVRDVVGGMPT